MAIADAPRDLATARAALAAEWAAADPQTPAQVLGFYQASTALAADLDAWHALPERQAWTAAVVHVARELTAQRGRPLTVVDVGCGAGHDLDSLLAILPSARAVGVEPNAGLRAGLSCAAVAAVADAPLPHADLLLCLDVLEHIPDPETFLSGIAQRAPLGALLIEATATHDTTTPLHLVANRGWNPGRCLDRHGWQCIDQSHDRLRVWQRTALEAAPRTGLLCCAYRQVSVQTVEAILALATSQQANWRVQFRHGDALIGRARSILVSEWHRSTADDVCLLIDDDIVFNPADALNLVERCREGCDIIAGAYPVHDGGHLAIRGLTDELTFGPEQEPVEARYVSTGFLAVHRRVLDALIPTLPLVHGSQSWSFWPLFETSTIEDGAAGGYSLLSEDWHFCELARRAGFRVWVDPSVQLAHLSQVPVSISNMQMIHDAVQAAGRG